MQEREREERQSTCRRDREERLPMQERDREEIPSW